MVMHYNKNMMTTTGSLTETFTNGDCWVLALEIQKNYGFPIVMILDEEPGEEGEWDFAYHGGWTHAVNMLPNGNFVDIEGTYEGVEGLECLYHNYEGYFILEVTPEELRASVEDADIVRMSTDEELAQAMKQVSEGIMNKNR